ncbi:MAG: TIM barrel protein [Verrucomicrobiota bacterium]
MNLSLSVRIAEGFLSKEESIMDLGPLCELAKAAGFQSLCMRASQVGIHSSPDTIAKAAETIREHGLTVSMVTGDFDIVYNNEKGPDCLTNISPYLDLAQALGAPMIRVAIKKEEDIEATRKAADEAAKCGIRIVHQCHTLSLFETVEGILDTLRIIDRPNVGLIYEPANLEGCEQAYGFETLTRLKPWIFNVYLQNQQLKPGGSITLDTWCRGSFSFDLIQIHEAGGIDFPGVFSGLRAIGYSGPVTVHQSAPDGGSPEESATATAAYLKKLIASSG